MKRLPAVCGGLLPFVLLLLLAVGGCAQKGKKEDATRDALLPPESGKRVEQVKNEYVTLDLPPGWSVLQRTDQERGLCCLMAISKKDGTLMWIVVGADAGVLKTAFFGPLHKELEHTGSKESTSGKSRQQKNPGWQDYITDNGKQWSYILIIGKMPGKSRDILRKYFRPHDLRLFPTAF